MEMQMARDERRINHNDMSADTPAHNSEYKPNSEAKNTYGLVT